MRKSPLSRCNSIFFAEQKKGSSKKNNNKSFIKEEDCFKRSLSNINLKEEKSKVFSTFIDDRKNTMLLNLKDENKRISFFFSQ